MKFWQLEYVCSRAGQPELLATKATEREEWRQFGEWWRHHDDLVDAQDRDKLDFELPDDYVRSALSEVKLALYESQDGVWLYYPRFAQTDHELSALEAYVRYGGEVIDGTLEKGVTRIEVRDNSS